MGADSGRESERERESEGKRERGKERERERERDVNSFQEGSIEVTGNLGDVMKESVRTALTVAKGVLAHEQPDNHSLHNAHIHVHVPEVCSL